MSAASPGQIVIDKKAARPPSLKPGIVLPAYVGKRRIGSLTLQDDGKGRQRLRVIARSKETGIPRESGVEVVHQVLGENVRVSRTERILGLRRDRVEEGIDGVGVL